MFDIEIIYLVVINKYNLSKIKLFIDIDNIGKISIINESN